MYLFNIPFIVRFCQQFYMFKIWNQVMSKESSKVSHGRTLRTSLNNNKFQRVISLLLSN